MHDVARYARSLPNVVFVEKTLFACSQDSQELIRKRIIEENLNRVVVAACTPRTHEPLFRETLRASGLNECLFEMANIRNQLAWVHAAQPEQATRKAKDLVRMAVAKAALLKPVPPVSVRITPQALVIGGGLAGMTAALALADQGFPVHLVEKAVPTGRDRAPSLQDLERRGHPFPHGNARLQGTGTQPYNRTSQIGRHTCGRICRQLPLNDSEADRHHNRRSRSNHTCHRRSALQTRRIWLRASPRIYSPRSNSTNCTRSETNG